MKGRTRRPSGNAQLELPAKGRGGRRPGAGRPKSRTSGVSHLRRARFKNLPVHITLKVREDAGNLRTDKRFLRIQRAFYAACDHLGMRILQFSVQGNHIHLVVEAVHHRALAKAMQGLAIRLAKGINRLTERTGAVFADRYHAHLLKTPAEVRNAVHYVVYNRQKHRRTLRLWTHPWDLDEFSSASGQACWYVADGGEAAMIIVEPRTWLAQRAATPPVATASGHGATRRRPARRSSMVPLFQVDPERSSGPATPSSGTT
jgi:REP-associated tyrosine transposase